MKIVLVIDQFDDANNGTTISARRFASALKEHGNEVRVIATGKPTDYKYAVRQMKFLPIVAVVCLGCVGIYYVMGTTLGTGAMTEAGAAQVGDLLAALADSYHIGPVTLIPLVVMIVCIVVQVPAIPSFLLGVVLAMVEAANTGVVSTTGYPVLDELFSTGGIEEMLPTIAIVILVMAYVGILQHTGLMQSLIEPITSKLKSFASLAATTVASGAVFNILLPDQYPAIALSCKMYGDAFEGKRVRGDVWSNIVNSSAGITSVLVPWNTCSIYMVTILGVACIDYLPFALFCFLYPAAVALIAMLFGRRLGWVGKAPVGADDDGAGEALPAAAEQA